MSDLREKAVVPPAMQAHCGKQMCRGLEMMAWIRNATVEENESLIDLLVARMLGEKSN